MLGADIAIGGLYVQDLGRGWCQGRSWEVGNGS